MKLPSFDDITNSELYNRATKKKKLTVLSVTLVVIGILIMVCFNPLCTANNQVFSLLSWSLRSYPELFISRTNETDSWTKKYHSLGRTNSNLTLWKQGYLTSPWLSLGWSPQIGESGVWYDHLWGNSGKHALKNGWILDESQVIWTCASWDWFLGENLSKINTSSVCDQKSCYFQPILFEKSHSESEASTPKTFRATTTREPKRTIPIESMYGIFTYIWLIFMVNVAKYTIHGYYGIVMIRV